MSPERLTAGGWTRRSFNQGPFCQLEEKRQTLRGDGRGDEQRFREMNVSKAEAGVPRMSGH